MNRREFVAMAPAFPVAAVSASLTVREDGKAPVELDVSVLKVQPGDTLVMRSRVPLKREQVDRVKQVIEAMLPGVQALVLTHDVAIEGVLRGPS